MTRAEPEPTTLALDADVVIYSAATDHPLGRRVLPLFENDRRWRLVGSTLLLPELLIKPRRRRGGAELDVLTSRLARMQLVPADARVCTLAVAFGALYGLRPIDAVHLATAVEAGAQAFVTNNTKDFSRQIAEIHVIRPAELEIAN